MIDSIHQSTLNMAFRCGEQLRRRYIEGEIIPPSIPAGRGTGVHKGSEVNLKQKVRTKHDLPIGDLKDAARDGYVRAFRNGVYLAKEERSAKEQLLNEGLNDTLRLTQLYREEVAPKIQPKAVEQEFCIDVGLALPLGGRIDFQQEPSVHDLKSTKKTWPENQIDKEIQPIFYSYAHEHETGIRPTFYYHILIALKTKTKLQEQALKPTDKHYQALFAKIYTFIQMIKTGTFPPANPSSWWCSEKWCGYYLTCPYVGNTLPKKWL